MGIRILALLDGKDFDVCVAPALGDVGQCETFSGSNMQQNYYLIQMVVGKYVTIKVPNFGGNLNVCELEILVADDCATPASTGGPTPEPTAPAPTGGPTPEPTAPAPTGGPTPEPTAPAPTGGPTPEPTAPAPTGGPTPDGTFQQPPTCDTDSAIYFIDITLSGSDISTQDLASSIGCTLAELKQRIAEYVDSTNSGLADSVAGFKSEMDKSINNFLAEDKARVETMVQAAASSATSPAQLRMMAEVVIGSQLAANAEMMSVIIDRAVQNGFAVPDIRKEMVAVLANTAGKSEAIQRLAGYAAGPGNTLADEKSSFIDLQAAAIRQSENVIETVNSLTTAFGTSPNIVGSTMATIVAASTGADEASAMDVIDAVVSSGAGRAAGILLTGLNDPGSTKGSTTPLITVLATARVNEIEFSNMKTAMADFVQKSVSNAKVASGLGEKIDVNLNQLEFKVHDLEQTLKGVGSNAIRKKVSLGNLLPTEALMSGAEDAANTARSGAIAGARKASASDEARY